MSLEHVYQRLPIFLQNAVCSAVGRRIQRTRYGPAFEKCLAEAERRMQWSRDRLLEYRDRRLRAFVRHSAESVPYYRRLFRREGIDPHKIRGLDELKEIPILTKPQVQRHGREMLSEAVPRRRRTMTHTSGTTGGGLRLATTPDALREQWAIWWRYRRWHDIQPGTWCGYFGGRSVVPLAQAGPPFWRVNRPQCQILFSGYHMSDRNLGAYLAELRRRRPPWLHGYPSLLALLATHLLGSGENLGYQVRWITVGAENLLPQQARVVEQAFGVRPRQHYGMAEAVANVSECEHGALHVDEDFAAVEFVPNSEGPGYRVVGTNFTNPATPLLRYDVQDLLRLADAGCPCARPGRLVEAIDGRREDYVVLRNGARVGRMDHIFKDLVSIREAQIFQCEPGRITIRVVRGSAYTSADEQRLLGEARQRLGEDTGIDVRYVEKLPRSPTGKLRFVVSELGEGRLDAACDPAGPSQAASG